MNQAQRTILNVLFAVFIVAMTALVAQRFFVPLLWAGVLCIASWPLYLKLERRLGGRRVLAALLMTAAVAALFLLPIAYGLLQAGREAPVLAHFIAEGNTEGITPPGWLQRVPWVGVDMQQWWQATLGQPHGLAHLVAGRSLGRLASANEVLRSLGTQVTHRLVDIALAFLCLFFFYKDGRALEDGMRRNAIRLLGLHTWERYAHPVPVAIRATVNGLVLVGLAEGVVIGIAYFFAGVRSPVIWAAATGVLAIIPFGAPLVYVAASAVLLLADKTGAAIGVLVWGSIVLFIADHFVRPHVIGNATRLPFLAVLFGILGGVETMGLVGLFVGPALMALFMTLWNERDEAPAAHMRQ